MIAPVTLSSQDARQRIQKSSVLSPRWQRTPQRTRVQLLAAAVLVIGSASFILEGLIFRGLRDGVQYALIPSQLLSISHPEPETPTEAHVASVTAIASTPEPSPSPVPSTPRTFASPIDRECYEQRDLGLIPEILDSRREFCERKTDDQDETHRTHVTFIDLEPRGSLHMRAMIFHRDLELDFTHVQVNRPISSISQDGGDHDPRFTWTPSMISCGCSEFQEFATEFYRESGNRSTLRPWEPMVADTDKYVDESSTVCGKPAPTPVYMQTPPPASAPAPLRVIDDRTVIIARRDDHNPFFQLSGALNAWMLTRTLGWNRNDTRVIFMDGGFPSPIDDLHYRLLSTPGKFTLLRGGDHLLGHKFKFTNDVMFAPYETTGPLMQHLNDEEPCQRSQLITEFRADALAAMGIATPDPSMKKAITVTIISRRNYKGRRVQRRWLNEDEVLAAMREKYPSFNGMPIVIQSLEFVDLTLEQQMEISLNSDVVIGMHGAGMVNVLWTRPGTLVIEIFPRFRYRWGYRNICQYTGCDWHEFRGGGDTGMGDNASHKTIYVEPWLAFFDPLFRKQVGMPPADAAGSVSNAENASTAATMVERSRAMRSPFFQP